LSHKQILTHKQYVGFIAQQAHEIRKLTLDTKMIYN